MKMQTPQSRFHLLIVEDSEDDALLVVRALRQGGFDPHWERVESREALREALSRRNWDLAITDHNLPGLDAMESLAIIHKHAAIPVIIVSGNIGEELAVEAMRHGASDYIMKDNLRRLVPAVERELREAGLRKAHSLARHALRHLSRHDALTGLLNRATFEELIAQLIEEGDSDGSGSCVIMDIEHFRLINDTFGHAAGDELLRAITMLLNQEVRSGESLARIGGDEFGWLMPGVPGDEALERARHLSQAVEKLRFTWENRSLRLRLNIGVVPIADAGGEPSDVFAAADLAILQARESGSNLALFSREDERIAARRAQMDWTSRIDTALDNDGFLIYHQTIQPLQEGDQGHHFEILLRMCAQDGSPIPPGTFIPAAERYCRMAAIDRWVIARICQRLGTGRCAVPVGPHDLVAVNLSGQSLGDARLLDFVREQIREHGVNPAHLCFEITETAAISNYHNALEFMSGIKDLGCRLALDDFGSGLSSLAYLKNLPVDYLKIDGVFIRHIDEDRMDRTIVEAVHRIAREAGMRTIAEFVENARIIEVLRDIGIDYAQGYAIDRPSPVGET